MKFFKFVAATTVMVFNFCFTSAYAMNNNINLQNYNANWYRTISSYIEETENGISIANGSKDGIEIKNFDKNDNLLNEIKIEPELTIYGGFYFGDKYNFAVWGDTNDAEDDTKEVFRVVKYDKDGNRISASSIYGANTVKPFNAGSLRMVEYGNLLYVRTCHQMYTTYDGNRHQANVIFSINTDDMSVIQNNYGISFATYSSHSFNQFIDVVDGDLIAADHGDAYPRSIAFNKFNVGTTPTNGNTLENGKFTQTANKQIDALKIKGAIGNNYTGACVGGMTAGDNKYIIVGSSIDQSENSDQKYKNIFVSTIDKNDYSVNINWITADAENLGYDKGNPVITKISGTKFLLMWNDNKVTKGCIIDENGKKLTDITKINKQLSDCQPILIGDEVVWYTYNGSEIEINRINVSNDKITENDEETNGILGDVNQDGQVNATDVTAIIKNVVRGESFSSGINLLADINKDGQVNATDITAIIKSIVD